MKDELKKVKIESEIYDTIISELKTYGDDLYVKCSHCDKVISVNSKIVSFRGHCACYCSKECFAEVYGTFDTLDLEEIENRLDGITLYTKGINNEEKPTYKESIKKILIKYMSKDDIDVIIARDEYPDEFKMSIKVLSILDRKDFDSYSALMNAMGETTPSKEDILKECTLDEFMDEIIKVMVEEFKKQLVFMKSLANLADVLGDLNDI